MSSGVYQEWPDRMTVEEYLSFEERSEERHEYFAGYMVSVFRRRVGWEPPAEHRSGEFTFESIGLTLTVESMYP